MVVVVVRARNRFGGGGNDMGDGFRGRVMVPLQLDGL